MRFQFLILLFLFVFGSFHGVQAQEADKTQIEDDIFGLKADFDFEKPEKTPYAEKLSEIVEMEHGYYGDMIFSNEIIDDDKVYVGFFNSAFRERLSNKSLYSFGFGSYHLPENTSFEDTLVFSPENLRQKVSERGRTIWGEYIDIDYIIENVSGIPRHGVINKWNKKVITVSYIEPLPLKKYQPDLVSIIKEEIKKRVSELNELNEFTFIYDENAGVKADIIFRVSSDFPSTLRVGYIDNHLELKDLFYGTLDFALSSLNGSNGFIIPNQNNEILKSYCNISTYITNRQVDISQDFIDDVKVDVAQCLLHGMGLTGTVPKRFSIIKEDDNYFSVLIAPQKDEEDKRTQQILANNTYFKYDLILLQMLYCDRIKAGDDRNRAQFYYPSCFLQAVDFREKEKQE